MMNEHCDRSDSLFLPPGHRLRTRELETAFVNHSKSTGLWITTISNKDYKSSKKGGTLKAFSFRSESEAKETAYVNTPPKMIPSNMISHCFTCESKFSIFRRPKNCRNCGVCICNSCTMTWNSTMVPETYMQKNTRFIKVCKTCDYLSTSFRHSLLSGDYDKAKQLYMTGNINLRCPFSNIKRSNEIMLPVHCAANGGNVRLLRWMVDIHFCPLQKIRTGNKNNQSTSLIKTSKDRTVVDIAMDHKRIDILKYLVNIKNISLTEGNNKHPSFGALEILIKSQTIESSSEQASMMSPRILASPRTRIADSPSFSSRKKSSMISPRVLQSPRKVIEVSKPSSNENSFMISPKVSTPKFIRNVVRVRNSEMFAPNQRDKEFIFDRSAQRKEPPELPHRVKTLSRISISSTASETSSDDSSKLPARGRRHQLPQRNQLASKPQNKNPGIPSYSISKYSDESEGENVDEQEYNSDVEMSELSFDDESVSTTVEDQCIICCESSIDCVFTPCGHQICCLECSSNMSKCPICSTQCQAIRIFKP